MRLADKATKQGWAPRRFPGPGGRAAPVPWKQEVAGFDFSCSCVYNYVYYIYIYYYYYSSSKLPKFRKCTYTMNPSYSRPVSLDPLFSQPVSLCVTCFTPVKWLVAMGRPFSSIWKLFGTMSMPCVVPEMLWSLDELKRVLISEFPFWRLKKERVSKYCLTCLLSGLKSC